MRVEGSPSPKAMKTLAALLAARGCYESNTPQMHRRG